MSRFLVIFVKTGIVFVLVELGGFGFDHGGEAGAVHVGVEKADFDTHHFECKCQIDSYR